MHKTENASIHFYTNVDDFKLESLGLLGHQGGGWTPTFLGEFLSCYQNPNTLDLWTLLISRPIFDNTLKTERFGKNLKFSFVENENRNQVWFEKFLNF